MRKLVGIASILLGAVLIVSALLLVGFNERENQVAEEASGQAMTDLQKIIDESAPAMVVAAEDASAQADVQIDHVPRQTVRQEDLDPEMPIAQIDGYEYIGYISIPKIKVNLPVMSKWDYSRLKYAPCRQFGSSRTDDLVIAAHNYSSHFGKLSSLKAGDRLTFTDMENILNIYAVEIVETLDPTRVDIVEDSGYDLVLYTCTYGGRERVVAFCNRVEDVEQQANAEA